MLTPTELTPLVINWAKERNINCPEKQTLKLIEEVGELASAYLKQDNEKLIDSIGDVWVVLVILADLNNEKIDYFENNKDINVLDGIWNILTQIQIYDSSTFAIKSLQRIAKQLKLDFNTCINHAWNEIKHRKGKTVNNTFIKDEDRN